MRNRDLRKMNEAVKYTVIVGFSSDRSIQGLAVGKNGKPSDKEDPMIFKTEREASDWAKAHSDKSKMILFRPKALNSYHVIQSKREGILKVTNKFGDRYEDIKYFDSATAAKNWLKNNVKGIKITGNTGKTTSTGYDDSFTIEEVWR